MIIHLLCVCKKQFFFPKITISLSIIKTKLGFPMKDKITIKIRQVNPTLFNIWNCIFDFKTNSLFSLTVSVLFPLKILCLYFSFKKSWQLCIFMAKVFSFSWKIFVRYGEIKFSLQDCLYFSKNKVPYCSFYVHNRHRKFFFLI